MNMLIIYPILVFIAGAMTALQPLVNAKLSNHVDAPIWASFISFAVAIYAVPHLGVSVLVALLIAGQLIFSAILSHYGILTDQAQPITWVKFGGLLFLGLGALMVLKG